MCMIKNPELVNGYLVSVSLAKRNEMDKRNEMEWSVKRLNKGSRDKDEEDINIT